MNHDGLFDIVTYVGEVINIKTGDTYKRNEGVKYPSGKKVKDETGKFVKTEINASDMLFSIDVQYTLNGRPQYIYNVKPFNANIKQIPLVGESILVFQAISHETTVDEAYPQWYYMYPISISSNVNSNVFPTIESNTELDPKDVRKEVSPLQPYRGDLMLEGRYGNSIRFGSTVDYQNDYSVTGNWRDGENGDPILIISNGRPYKPDKQFVTEDVSKDDSSLYLTSTQTLSTLKLSKTFVTDKFGTFRGSQFVGVADRTILRAKTEAAVIDANEAIVLNTNGEVLIGGDDAASPLPHGDVLIEVLTDIIQAISAGTIVAGVTGVTNGTASIISAWNSLQSLNSKKYKIRKP